MCNMMEYNSILLMFNVIGFIPVALAFFEYLVANDTPYTTSQIRSIGALRRVK